MTIFANATMARLRAGGLALGFGVNHLRTIATAQLAKASGYDWLSIDMEHGAFSMHEASQLCIAALPLGITPFARIGVGAYGDGTRALDNGAQGVIVPQMEDAAEAARAVAAFRYPPLGTRGWGGVAPHFGYTPQPVAQAQEELNRETSLVVVIESPLGVTNAGAIAAIAGVDILLLGSSDLSTQLGIPGRYDDPQITSAFQRVAEACDRHGKILGMGGVYDQEWAQRYHDMGARFIAGGSDHSFLTSAATARAKFLRNLAQS